MCDKEFNKFLRKFQLAKKVVQNNDQKTNLERSVYPTPELLATELKRNLCLTNITNKICIKYIMQELRIVSRFLSQTNTRYD